MIYYPPKKSDVLSWATEPSVAWQYRDTFSAWKDCTMHHDMCMPSWGLYPEFRRKPTYKEGSYYWASISHGELTIVKKAYQTDSFLVIGSKDLMITNDFDYIGDEIK